MATEDTLPRLDRLERLTDLVLVLVNARRPLTLDEIAVEVPGYPAGHAARRQAFERDKRLLREEGVPLLTEPVEGPAQFGYRIDRDQYYLPALELDPAERIALHLAVAGVHLGDSSGRDALVKLGAGAVEPLAQVAVQATLAAHPHLSPVFEALRTAARLRFRYRDRDRTVSPAGLWFRRGRWYLVAWDHGPEAVRTFRVDRITEPPIVDVAGSASVPGDVDPAASVPDVPWQIGDAPELEVVLDVDPVESPRVIDELGSEAVVKRDEEGAVRARLAVSNFAPFRSWLLGMLDHVVVVEPSDARRQVIEWLEAIARPQRPRRRSEGGAAAASTSTGSTQLAGARPGDSPAAAGRPSPEERPSTGSDPTVRLRRLLAMMGWLAAVGEASLAELAQRFGITEDEVAAELELAACCGLPPYTPDVLMEIVVTDRRVVAQLPERLARPRPLTASQGLAVVAAARTILAIPGSDPDGALARALAKLEHAIGEHQRLGIDLGEPPRLPQVREAIDSRHRLQLTYHAASTDRTTDRTVEPLRLSSIQGHWYLDALDVDALEHGSPSTRRFRVDRIRALVDTGVPAGPAWQQGAGDPGPAFVPGPDAVAVRLRLRPAAAWVLDSVDVEDVVALDGGDVEVTLFVGGMAWLERLLLQLGPEGHVVAPARLKKVGPKVAERVLQRYGVEP